jgi:hypothetical protein
MSRNVFIKVIRVLHFTHLTLQQGHFSSDLSCHCSKWDLDPKAFINRQNCFSKFLYL